MLRQDSLIHPFHWADKTMSVLRADQLEACEKELAGLPFRCLFDHDCTDQDAETIYSLSWFPREDRKKREFVLHTVEGLRVRVLSSFAAELALLAPDEHDLLVRLVLFGGKIALHDWEDFLPARSLIRRLWCSTRMDNGVQTLYMSRQLCATALLLLAQDAHKKVRDAVDTVYKTIDNSLYLMGMMQASAAALHLQALLKGTHAENRPDLVERMFLAGCDTVFDDSGRLILIHPGLADPAGMLLMLPAASGAFRAMDERDLRTATDSIDDLESPLYEQMLSSIMDATRPELTPEDAVEDLIILAKQDVPYTALVEVLSSLLVSLPNADMLKALRDLSERTPRWIWFSSSRVQ